MVVRLPAGENATVGPLIPHADPPLHPVTPWFNPVCSSGTLTS